MSSFRWASGEVRKASSSLGRRPGPREIENIARQVNTGNSEIDSRLELTIKIYALCHRPAQVLVR